MEENVKVKIDKELRKDKFRHFFKLGFPEVFVISIISLALIAYFPIGSESIEGNAYKLSANPANKENEKVMLVELDDGNVKAASMPEMMVFQLGARVELLETTGLAGSKKYRVVKYLK